MENKKIINIAYSSDDNFAQHLCVSAFSLLKNLSSENKVQIIILDGGISEKNKKKIVDSLSLFNQKIYKINFVNIDKSAFKGLKESKSITLAAYYRISLPALFPDIEKVIYLDCDLIIENNIEDLYNIDFGDSMLLAVKDSSIEMEKEYSDILHIPNTCGYFNSGVMVLDLEKFKKENISEKIIASLKKINYLGHSHDQSSLNAVLYNKWKTISPAWNQLAGISIEKNYRNTTYTKDDFDRAKFNPNIIHFSSRFAKPWLYESISPLKSRYFYYLEMTRFCDFRPQISLKIRFKKIMFILYFFYLPKSTTTLIYRWMSKIL